MHLMSAFHQLRSWGCLLPHARKQTLMLSIRVRPLTPTRGQSFVRHIDLFIAAASMTFVTACVEDHPLAASRLADYKPFDLKTRPHFSSYQNVVGSYLRREALGEDSHACVVGLTRGGRDTDVVWVIWRGGDRLIRWFPGENNLELSSRNLSLTEDVVPTDADIGTSTYLESRPWVNELERLCEKHGRRVSANQQFCADRRDCFCKHVTRSRRSQNQPLTAISVGRNVILTGVIFSAETGPLPACPV